MKTLNLNEIKGNIHMGNQKVYKGICYNCGNEYAKRGMTRHLKSCRDLQKQQEQSGEKDYLLMRVQGKYNKRYFLYLDIKEKTTMDDFDQFLRDIWLECCGHLSGFYINGQNYTFYPFMHERAKNNPKNKIKNVLENDTKYEYKYDFGTTTGLEVEIISKRSGQDREHLIEVVARNILSDIECDECGAKAKWFCQSYDCFPYYYCDDCVEENKGEFGAVPFINTPRLGACGYPSGAEENRI